MSDDPAAWLPDVMVNPGLPDGVIVLDSGKDALLANLCGLRLAKTDPLYAEDLRSLTESVPFFIRIHEATEPIICECCGTLVAAVPEGLVSDAPGRRFTRAIWESETWRKHTLRRCDWKRVNR